MRFPILIVFGQMLFTCTVHGQSAGSTWVVKGCLVDRTNDAPLLFAQVRLQGTADTTVTDTLGCFILDLGSDPRDRRLYLVVDYNGFDRYTYRIKRKDLDCRRVHRLKRKKFARDIAEAKLATRS